MLAAAAQQPPPLQLLLAHDDVTAPDVTQQPPEGMLPGQSAADSGAPIESDVDRKQSELLILIQESYQDATTPIRELGAKLILEGIITAVILLLAVTTLWLFVLRRFSTAPSIKT